MHKINTDTATAAHEFTDGDEAQAIPSTDLNAAWFNSVQREICNVIEKTGGTLSDSSDTQLYDALVKIGFEAKEVTGGSYTVPTGWNGSTILMFTASNFSISGTFKDGSIIIIAPDWVSSSGDEITITISSTTKKLYNGQGLVYFVNNGAAAEAFRFTMPNANRIITGYIDYKNQIDSGVVDFANYYGGDDAREWMKASLWKVGQVKRLVFNGVPDYAVGAYYPDGTGSSISFSIYKTSFREFLCTGFVTVNGTQYAILKSDFKPTYNT